MVHSFPGVGVFGKNFTVNYHPTKCHKVLKSDQRNDMIPRLVEERMKLILSTHHSLVAVEDSPAGLGTAAVVGSPAAVEGLAGKPPAAGHTGHYLQEATMSDVNKFRIRLHDDY